MAKRSPIEKIKLPETEEQWIAATLVNFVTTHHCKIDELPEPQYPLWPGTAVEIGHLVDAVVVEQAYDGRVVVIKCRDVGEKYGVPYDNGFRYGAWPAVNVVPKAEIQSTKLAVKSWMFPFLTSSVGSVVSRAIHSGYVDNPDYQRGYVWTEDDKVALIESLLAGYPIGSFILKSRHDWRYEVIDGKQRLNTLIDFFHGKWAFKGLKWWNLSPGDRAQIDMRPAQVCELPKTATRLDCLRMFLACNVGGVPQSNEHLIKVQALYDAELKNPTQGVTHDV